MATGCRSRMPRLSPARWSAFQPAYWAYVAITRGLHNIALAAARCKNTIFLNKVFDGSDPSDKKYIENDRSLYE